MSKHGKYLACSRKYDVPLYCAAWTGAGGDGHRYAAESDKVGDGTQVGLVLVGGGGGERKNGVVNSLILAQYDFATDILSEATHTVVAEDHPFLRLAVHPGSDDVVCSVADDCRLIELRADEGLTLERSERVLQPLQNVGEQNCLVFSADGTRFATGGQDGHLRVFEWPSMELVLGQGNAHESVKDADFSLDSTLVASTGYDGPCRVWDISTASAVATLSSTKGGSSGFCRFSKDGTNPVLFVTLVEGGKGLIGSWDTRTWKYSGAKKLCDAPISAFSISPNGKFLAIGSTEGGVTVVDAKKLGKMQYLRTAHMIFVTSMSFSPDGRALLSVSGDSSARVTAITAKPKRKGWGVVALFGLMLVFLLISAKVLSLQRPMERNLLELWSLMSGHQLDTKH